MYIYIRVILCVVLVISWNVCIPSERVCSNVRQSKQSSNEKKERMSNMSKGLIALAAGILIGVCFYELYNEMPEEKKKELSVILRKLKIPYISKEDDDTKNEISRAERNVRALFASAQNTFIHRNGKKMARSIDELGAGFKVGQNGALIYEEIWIARFNAPKNDSLSENEKLYLSRPYRYAVLPVEGLLNAEQDARTTCVVALSKNDACPTLVMVAGPVVSDPGDFLKNWEILHIKDSESKKYVRKLVESSQSYSKEVQKDLLQQTKKSVRKTFNKEEKGVK